MTRNQFNQKVSDFFNRWNGQPNNYDNLFGTQCKDLFSQYNRDVVGNPNYITGDAWKLYDAAPDSLYEKIINTKTSVPQRGDIIIWGNNYGGGYGHVAVADDGCNVNTMRVFGQNYPVTTKFNADGSVKSLGTPCQFATMSYTGVHGYLRPKNISDPETVVNPPVAEDPKDVRIRELEARVRELENMPPVIKEVEKIVEKPVEVIKEVPVEKIVESIEYKDTPETLKELDTVTKKKNELMGTVGDLSKKIADQKNYIMIPKDFLKNILITFKTVIAKMIVLKKGKK